MGVEIERKFLVQGVDWKVGQVGVAYRQGYLSSDPERTVRVRMAGEEGFLTIKGAARSGARREFEYRVPAAEAEQMLDLLCRKPLIEKCRYRIPFAGRVWEVDEFFGDNAGLVLAEIELDDVAQAFELPPWAGREVTEDHRFYNAYLAQHPLNTWPGEDLP